MSGLEKQLKWHLSDRSVATITRETNGVGKRAKIASAFLTLYLLLLGRCSPLELSTTIKCLQSLCDQLLIKLQNCLEGSPFQFLPSRRGCFPGIRNKHFETEVPSSKVGIPRSQKPQELLNCTPNPPGTHACTCRDNLLCYLVIHKWSRLLGISGNHQPGSLQPRCNRFLAS